MSAEAVRASLILPTWPAPAWVHACSTTRVGGLSQAPYDSFNLAQHVGDDVACVSGNRQRLMQAAGLPQAPQWLTQIHGKRVVALDSEVQREADSSYTSSPHTVCAVMTADCLPILLCHRRQPLVAAIHAGWRGLAEGVIEATLARFAVDAAELMAWLGPAIGSDAFEVGEDVYQALATDALSAVCFKPQRPRHWLADLYALARLRLRGLGVEDIYGGEFCTYREGERFFSYRRDGVCGRMASLIWIAD